MARIRKATRERKRMVVSALASVAVLILADFVLALLFGSQIRSSSPFAFGINDEDTSMSLLFLEGGITFGLGAFFASGIADTRATIETNARNADGIEKSVSRVAEQRKKLMSAGTVLMLIGGLLLAISFFLAIVSG
jgi:MFS family permease